MIPAYNKTMWKYILKIHNIEKGNYTYLYYDYLMNKRKTAEPKQRNLSYGEMRTIKTELENMMNNSPTFWND